METAGKIRYRAGHEYQLADSWWVQTKLTGFVVRVDGPLSSPPWVELRADGRLSVNGGYAWDGPSGPTWDTPNFMRGSLAHDALYQLMREEKLPQDCREPADELLREICRADGMNWVRAQHVYLAVRGFAAKAAKPKKTPVFEAPR